MPDTLTMENNDETMLTNFLIWLRSFPGLRLADLTDKRARELAREWLAFRDEGQEEDMETRLARQQQQHIEDKQYYSPQGLHEDE